MSRIDEDGRGYHSLFAGDFDPAIHAIDYDIERMVLREMDRQAGIKCGPLPDECDGGEPVHRCVNHGGESDEEG